MPKVSAKLRPAGGQTDIDVSVSMVGPLYGNKRAFAGIMGRLRVHHRIVGAVQVGGVDVSREELRGFFEAVLPHLNEVQRRVVAGAMATAMGRGGKTAVAEAS
jgi:hypothetical protein